MNSYVFVLLNLFITEQYRISSIGMKVALWKEIITLEPMEPVQSWAKLIEQEAISVHLNFTEKFFDQSLVSFYIHRWLKQHPKGML